MKDFLAKTPDEVIAGCFNKFCDNRKKDFALTLLISVVTSAFCYLYLIIYGFAGPDGMGEGIYYYVGANISTGSGRWFIRYLNQFMGNNVIIPIVTVIFYALMIGTSAFILCKLLNIVKTGYIVLMTAAMVSFPVVVLQFGYLYTALCFSFAFLASVAGVSLVRKKGVCSFIFGTAMFLLMFGSYQSYIGAVAALALIMLMYDMFNEAKVSKAFISLGKVVLAGVIAAVLDLPIINLVAKINNVEFYDRVSEFSIGTIFENLGFSLKYSYVWFFSFFTEDTAMHRNVLYYILIAIIVILVILSIAGLFKKKKITNAVITVALVLLLPLFFNICVVIFPTNGIYDVMRYHYVYLFALLFAMLGMVENIYVGSISQWISYALVFVLIASFTITDNATGICYKLAYDATYTQATMMLEKVYDLEDYDQFKTPIVLGGIIHYDYTYARFPMLFQYAKVGPGPIFYPDGTGATEGRFNYFSDFLGVNPGYVSFNEYHAIVTSKEFKEMPVWPETGSVKMINGYAVIKTEENPSEW